MKNHFFSFPFGVDVILGNNGSIWITETPPVEEGTVVKEEEEQQQAKDIVVSNNEL